MIHKQMKTLSQIYKMSRRNSFFFSLKLLRAWKCEDRICNSNRILKTHSLLFCARHTQKKHTHTHTHTHSIYTEIQSDHMQNEFDSICRPTSSKHNS